MHYCIANVLRALRTLLPGICIMCDIYTHYTSLLCKDVMFESHLDHLEPLHVGGTLIDCYLRKYYRSFRLTAWWTVALHAIECA